MKNETKSRLRLSSNCISVRKASLAECSNKSTPTTQPTGERGDPIHDQSLRLVRRALVFIAWSWTRRRSQTPLSVFDVVRSRTEFGNESRFGFSPKGRHPSAQGGAKRSPEFARRIVC